MPTTAPCEIHLFSRITSFSLELLGNTNSRARVFSSHDFIIPQSSWGNLLGAIEATEFQISYICPGTHPCFAEYALEYGAALHARKWNATRRVRYIIYRDRAVHVLLKNSPRSNRETGGCFFRRAASFSVCIRDYSVFQTRCLVDPPQRVAQCSPSKRCDDLPASWWAV